MPDPLQTIVPTNEALTIKEWIDLILQEHRYCLVPDRPDSPVKTAKVSVPVVNNVNMLSQLDSLLTALTETDEDSTTEVLVYQTHTPGDDRVELQELSEFDPYSLTHIEVQRPNMATQSSNSFSVQVTFKLTCETVILFFLQLSDENLSGCLNNCYYI